jgi:hypothetical protein
MVKKMKRYRGKRRCLKFTGYIYMPMAEDSQKTIRDYAVKLGCGRLMVYNEVNDRVGHFKPFNSVGGMVKIICDEFTKRARRRVPRR